MDELKILANLREQVESYQEPPRLGNQFLEDYALRNYIQLYLTQFKLDDPTIQDILMTLSTLGSNVIQYQNLALEAEQNPPRLQVFDAFGKRINKVKTSQAWKDLRIAAIKEKMVSDLYTGRFGPASRFVQVVKLYLFHSSSAMWGGPLGVTDGAAYLLKGLLGTQHPYKKEIENSFRMLTSDNPANAWTCGQWTTEKEGHIDPFQRIKTVAMPTNEPSIYKLYGVKWYSIVEESEVSIALARIIDENSGQPDERLSAFLIKLKAEGGELNQGIEITRLKDKLGSKTIAAAELVLKGVDAILISARGDGVKLISPMSSITRLYNAAASVSYARRVHVLCKDYSLR